MPRILLLITLLITLLTTLLPATAQQVVVAGHPGFADTTTRRVLVTLNPDTPAPASLPTTITIDGQAYTIDVTTLPLIRLDHAPDAVSNDTFCPATLTLLDPTQASTQQYPIELRYRGATSLAYTKRNYAVKLLDPATTDAPEGPQPLDAALLGLRADNSWILDAMASDHARMRGRVSTDLWLDFSRRPYYADDEPDMVNGTHGRFVEVFLADRYWGLYCLTEKVDRKQLKLKKHKDNTTRGIIYKSFSFDNLHVITDPNPSPQSRTWQGWECDYPDLRKGQPIDWTPLLDLYRFFCIEPPSFDLADHLQERVDLPLWRDYNIFCDLLHADDNTCKNIIIYYRDITSPSLILNDPVVSPLLPAAQPITVSAPGTLCVCPWDLDATWGRYWDRSLTEPTSNCNVSNAVNYHIWCSQRDAGHSYYTRWAELRTTYFTPQRIWPYFQRYFDLFNTSGAARRETERWQDVDGVHLDFEAEADYIRQWIPQRIAHLDADYQYTDPATGIVPPLTNPPADKSGDTAATPPVYTLDGRLAGHAATAADVSRLGLPPGLYTHRGTKILVR